jgi:hypothetical protein
VNRRGAAHELDFATDTFYMIFVIDLASRRVPILGSTPHAELVFTQQVVRTLTMVEAGAVPAPDVLICDRDRKWSGDVRGRLRDAGIRVVLTPRIADTGWRNGMSRVASATAVSRLFVVQSGSVCSL